MRYPPCTESPDCACGTGHYCLVHHRYGLKEGPHPVQSHEDHEAENRRHQVCGGGRRIIRKKIGGE